jgi:hypothetical protein
MCRKERMKVLQVQEADDKQTWVLKAPGEQVMADFPHTVEGHTDAVYVCDCVNNYEKVWSKGDKQCTHRN